MKKTKKAAKFDFKTIRSYEDACKRQKIDPIKSLPDVSGIPKNLKKYIIAIYKLTIIASAIRDGSKLNWADSNQWKHQPYHWVDADKKRPSGFGFSLSAYDIWLTSSYCSSRLCFESGEKAIYFAENFHDLWIDFKLEI